MLEPRRLLAADLVTDIDSGARASASDEMTQTVRFSDTEFQVTEAGEAVGAEVTVTRSHAVGEQSVAIQVYLDSAEDVSDIAGYAGRPLREQRFIVTFEEGVVSKRIPIAAMSAVELKQIAMERGEEYVISSTRPDAIVTLRDDELVEPAEAIRLGLLHSVRTWCRPTSRRPR